MGAWSSLRESRSIYEEADSTAYEEEEKAFEYVGGETEIELNIRSGVPAARVWVWASHWMPLGSQSWVYSLYLSVLNLPTFGWNIFTRHIVVDIPLGSWICGFKTTKSWQAGRHDTAVMCRVDYFRTWLMGRPCRSLDQSYSLKHWSEGFKLQRPHLHSRRIAPFFCSRWYVLQQASYPLSLSTSAGISTFASSWTSLCFFNLAIVYDPSISAIQIPLIQITVVIAWI